MHNYIIPDWPAPKNILAYTTTRSGGVSNPPYDSFNFSLITGDNPNDVLQNRKILATELNLSQEPFWLKQEHTNIAICIEKNNLPLPLIADASFTRDPNNICAVMTADCVPILVCDKSGTTVAAIHAGWKGIAKGIIQNTIRDMSIDPSQLLAWLGPAIGPSAFEVSQATFDIFAAKLPENKGAFAKKQTTYLANIYQLASIALNHSGITQIYGGKYCTFTQRDLFFSYRRDGEKSGRMASLIFIRNR